MTALALLGWRATSSVTAVEKKSSNSQTCLIAMAQTFSFSITCLSKSAQMCGCAAVDVTNSKTKHPAAAS